jgi:putative flippase GtrA
VTCPSLLHRGCLADGPGGDGSAPVEVALHRAADALGRVRDQLRGEAGPAQLARFALVGAISTALYGLVFLAAGRAGDQAANLAGAIASTMLANELHRRLTFRAGARVSWFTAQWEGGGLAVVGLATTSLTLAGFSALAGEVSPLVQIGLVTAVTGMIGLVRFVALRAWVFPTGSAHRG